MGFRLTTRLTVNFEGLSLGIVVSGVTRLCHCVGSLSAIPNDPKGRCRFDTQAILCTELTATPIQIVEWFIQRWQMEVTHREAREHLGVETQRQPATRKVALRKWPSPFGPPRASRPRGP